MITIKIFLASSKELEIERDKFASLINQLNRIYKSRGVELDLVLWEYLNSSVGHHRKQDEYNEEIKDSDICISIFWTQLGKYTKEEFKIAYDELIAGRNPQRLYVFFKEPATTSRELQQFKDSFERDYGHFYGIFENTDTLRLQFLLQLEMFENDSLNFGRLNKIENSTLTIGGVAFVNMQNVTFANRNDNYVSLQKQIDRQRQRLLKYPDDLEEQQQLHDMLDKRQKMEEDMLCSARMLYKQTLGDMSPLMIEARKLFEMGEFQAVKKILDNHVLMYEIESSRSKIEMLDVLKERELSNIDRSVQAMQLRIQTEKIVQDDGWIGNIISEYNQLIEKIRGFASPLTFAKLLFDSARFIDIYSPNILAASYYTECIAVMSSFPNINNTDLAVYGDMLFYAGRFFATEIFEIDYDPTAGEWMDADMQKVHSKVMKRWKGYRSKAKDYLTKSVEVFESINNSGNYSEDIFLSLEGLTSINIWDNNRGRRAALKKLVDYTRESTLTNDFLISALCKYAIDIFIDNKRGLNKILNECIKLASDLKPSQLSPTILLDISNVYEMKKDYEQARDAAYKALEKYEELSEVDPYIYQSCIAECLERLVGYIDKTSSNTDVNPEIFKMIERAQRIYEKLYTDTGSDVYLPKVGYMRDLKYGFRVREKINNVISDYVSITDELKNYFSSHISCGTHKYKFRAKKSLIKSIGIQILKTKIRGMYDLYFSFEIDDCNYVIRFGEFHKVSKTIIYDYLKSQECYETLKNEIVKRLWRTWDRD